MIQGRVWRLEGTVAKRDVVAPEDRTVERHVLFRPQQPQKLERFVKCHAAARLRYAHKLVFARYLRRFARPQAGPEHRPSAGEDVQCGPLLGQQAIQTEGIAQKTRRSVVDVDSELSHCRRSLRFVRSAHASFARHARRGSTPSRGERCPTCRLSIWALCPKSHRLGAVRATGCRSAQFVTLRFLTRNNCGRQERAPLHLAWVHACGPQLRCRQGRSAGARNHDVGGGPRTVPVDSRRRPVT